MSYKVLARKWRPKKFSDVVGQQHIVQAITNSFSLNKIHHAYILSGTRGVGKTTIARLLAKGLNCEQGATSAICGQCNSCQDIESGCFIDLIEIDAASRTKVEDTREFLDNVQYMPAKGRFKVYLIDEVHMLSRHSFNALLKILEEPPEHVKFILITTEHQKLPETILSRCLQFYLKPINISQIITQLKYIFDKESVKIESSALESLAHAAKGSMRDALSLAEQAIVLGNNIITNSVIDNMFGVLNIEYPLCLIEDLIDGNVHNVMKQIDNYSILGVNWDYFLSEMLAILQKIAMSQFLSNSIKKTDDDTIQNAKQRILKLSNHINPEDIQLYYQILLLGRRELIYTPSHRIGIEMIMLRALAFRPDTIDISNKNNNTSSNLIHSNNNSQFDTHNEQHTITHTNDQLKSHYKKNNILNSIESKKTDDNISKLNLKKPECLSDDVKPKCSISKPYINSIDITSKILEVRTKLLQYKEIKKLNLTKKISHTTLESQKTENSILERFSNINTKPVKNNSNHIDKINEYLPQDLKNKKDPNDIKEFYKNNANMSDFIRKIIQEVTNTDPWILQISQLSLSKLAKKLVMNSWKEEISSNEICLHVRCNYQHLISTELHNAIQQTFSEYMGIPIKLHIKKDDNYEIKTPMERIYILYIKKISKIKKEFLSDSCVEMISNFFDAKFDFDSIEIL